MRQFGELEAVIMNRLWAWAGLAQARGYRGPDRAPM